MCTCSTHTTPLDRVQTQSNRHSVVIIHDSGNLEECIEPAKTKVQLHVLQSPFTLVLHVHVATVDWEIVVVQKNFDDHLQI